MQEPNSNRNPNEFFGKAELWLVRAAVFVIFLVGLYKVVVDTLGKILK
jgi:F0F1-type ATP synthase membrane subunit b/b'